MPSRLAYPTRSAGDAAKGASIRCSCADPLAFERERLEAVILHDPRVIQEYLDVAALRETYQRYVSQGTASDAIILWKALILAAWLQRPGLTP